MGCCATYTIGLENENNNDSSLSEEFNKVSFEDITIFSDSEQLECIKIVNTEELDWAKSPRIRSTSLASLQHRNLEFAFILSSSLYTDRPVMKSGYTNSS
jgi:hypothetical protein